MGKSYQLFPIAHKLGRIVQQVHKQEAGSLVSKRNWLVSK